MRTRRKGDVVRTREAQRSVIIQKKQSIYRAALSRELMSWMATHVLHFFALQTQKCRWLAMTEHFLRRANGILSKKCLLVGMLFILSSCSCEIEDEQFTLIPGDFPNLCEVPDRPQHPNAETFRKIQQKLVSTREEAYQDKEKNISQLKK